MSNPKLQRWIDLLAALLAHRMPVTFKELAKDIPAYGPDAEILEPADLRAQLAEKLEHCIAG